MKYFLYLAGALLVFLTMAFMIQGSVKFTPFVFYGSIGCAAFALGFTIFDGGVK
jgi:hypothetical protein